MYENYLFYDIEVFKYNSLVVFKDINKNLIRYFHNDFSEISDFIKDKILVGFNNYFYDDKILTIMLKNSPQWMIKEYNDKIINGENPKIKINFKSLDTFQQCDVSKPSLKKIEGNMGKKIVESAIPFSINRPLTNEEFQETLEYCSYDVDSTIDIFKIRDKSYFQPKASLLKMLGKDYATRWNTTSISGFILRDKPFGHWNKTRVDADLWQIVPEQVREMWRQKSDSYENKADKKHVTIQDFDCEIQFGFGGLHGVHKSIKRARNVKLLDVASMYPNIILILDALGISSEKYKEILDQRLAVKKTDEILSNALKLILNSVYGNLGNEYSILYNPKAALSVCIYGQIALYELCKRISHFGTILNINTDGVIFIPLNNDNSYIAAYKDWEQEFELQLEEKEFDLFIQKDVNSYICMKNGKIKCKGADVNRYEEEAYFKNNNARILDLALVNKLVYGIDVFDTFQQNLDKPQLFQYILKPGNTFLGTFDEKGTEYNKVNRVFAAKEGICLYKKRADNTLVHFADAPLNMFLWNDDCSSIDNFQEIVDLDHYNRIINNRLERWSQCVY